ncbi:hypothetical protein [Streptomyces sp. NBC_01497]|uniref:hypothetical protein n=1 Tax=Streptomyces sp. NBC_01497 TaxID=2903885 RepID=UPI002E3529A8|nr:hypothetical protein [Streptomyces sp. NBC_01497]
MVHPVPVYESHITVLCEGDELRRLERWAAARAGVKFTHIALARGRTASQPMLTLRGSRPTCPEEVSAVRQIADALAHDGFAVARIKVECAPWAAEVPRGDARIPGRADAGRHFEHHVKLLLDPAYDRDALVALAVRHGAHVSCNARRRRPDGREERFVTQRCHGVGAPHAERLLHALLSDLGRYEVLDVEREYVLVDTGPELDEGWLVST